MSQTQTTPAAAARRAAAKKKPVAAKKAAAASVSRRTRKKERTRQRIYEAAIALFTKRGFDSVTIEEICEAADVAKATFFLHFRTKASLIFENTARLTERVRAELARPSKSAREDLERMTRLMLQHWSENSEVMDAMLRELLTGPMTEISGRPENEEFIALCVEIFRRGQQNGEFRTDVLPEIAAATFFVTLSALGAINVQRTAKLSLAPLVSQFLSMVLDGLVSPKARKK